MHKRIIKKDKFGEPFEIGCLNANDLSFLLEMYCNFTPKPASQGIPPPDSEACQAWVTRLFNVGINCLAWKKGRVIGHAVLIPDPERKSGEFIIFVHQNHRNVRVGTELLLTTLEVARGLGFQSVWLSVETCNFIGIKLYRNSGFKFCDMDSCERIMILMFSR